MESGENRWRSLDTLKGIAIFAVVLFHVKGTFPGAFPGVLEFFYQWGGYLGNYLFFMISGLCISRGYRDRIAGREISFLAFMKRRLVRLYPMYFITELICLPFLAGQPGSDALTLKEILRNLLCINYGWFENSLPYNFPCWFLSQLLLLYIVHFAALRLFRERAPLAFAALVIWGEIILKAGLDGPFRYAQDGEGFSNYFLGCLLFELLTRTRRNRRRIGEGIGAGLLLAFALRAAMMSFAEAAGDVRDVFTLLICPLLILVVLDWGPVRRALELPSVYGALAPVSMYVFFWHIPVLRTYIYLFSRYHWYRLLPSGGQLAIYLILLYAFCRALAPTASAGPSVPAQA